MSMSKTYLTGKIGKSAKFNPESWGAVGGDNEFPTLIRKLAELNPNDTFIIIGRNDVLKHRETLNIPRNIRDVYEGASKEEKDDVNYLNKRLKDVKIDGCFLMSGPTANCNIPNKSWKRKELAKGQKEYAKSLETFQNYVAPIYQYLNESNIPWVLIANDPRYISQGNDLMNQPQKILSQYDETIFMQTFDNFEDQNYVKNTIKSNYTGMEKIFLIDKKINIAQKNINFMMVLNEGNNGVKSRYPMLKEYVLDSMDDVSIYGKWDEETIGNDPRFKGPKKFEELQKELPNVKYTFIIPIKPGWVTSKWVEMISNGIIPFFHSTYDMQKHCHVPEYIRIKNPRELHEKIEFLNNNQSEYKKILNECLACITEDDLSGRALNNTIMLNLPVMNDLVGTKSFDENIQNIQNNQNIRKEEVTFDEW